ncbi:MAG: hypothetical protein ACYTGL_25390 [Planctomycetota bacterium]
MTTLSRSISRRHALRLIASGAVAPPITRAVLGQERTESQTLQPKRVAAVVSVYNRNSHADVILGKIMEGWEHRGGPGPALQLVSMYVDQFSKRDLARGMAEKHGVRVCSTIREALTLGGDKLAIDGVLSIGEHGDYPHNEIGQHLYPRRRFFSEIAAAMESCGQVVPVFNDKSLSTVWDNAKWVYDRAKQLNIPLMAGSSLPVTFRQPNLALPIGTPLKEIVGVGYGGLDAYGFHALESVQAFAERRRGGETGVEWVECLSGNAMWAAVDRGEVSTELLHAALKHVPTVPRRTLRDAKSDNAALYRFQHRDGLRGSVFMLQGYTAGFGVAYRTADRNEPFATHLELRDEPRYPHFAYLVKSIEQMMQTGQPTWPVERTLLTGGILDRALTSRFRDGQRLQTPELTIGYQPSDVTYAPHLKLNS